MLFPHNDTDNPSNGGNGPTTGWNHWLQPTDATTPGDPDDYYYAAPPTPADPADPAGGVPVEQSSWSHWLQSPDPDTASSPAEAGGEQPPSPPRRRRGVVLCVVGGVIAAAGAVAAGAGVLMSQQTTPAPDLPTPAATPPSAAAPTSDARLGGGPGCKPVRTPELVRGNGPGSTGSGPDAILAFQHGYYTVRSGAVAREVVTPDAAVSPPEVIDAGIAITPPGTRYCITITPLARNTYTVLIAETRPDTSRRNYQQEVTVAPVGDATLITRIGPVE